MLISSARGASSVPDFQSGQRVSILDITAGDRPPTTSMAEVLAIASGIAGLISLTIEVYGISCRYIHGVRNAKSSARRFLEELKNSEIVLLRIEKLSKENDQVEVFGDSGSCILSITKTNEYIDLLHKVRDKLEQRQTGSSIRDGKKSLIWPFTEKDTSALAESLHRHLEIYNTSLAIDNLTISKLTLNEVKQSKASHADSKNQEILDWLSPLNMYQKQQDTLSRRHGTTGSWLLNHSVFQKWIDSDESHRTLWCPGDPGTGKTVITSVVIDYLTNNYAGEDTKVVYLYCDYKDQAVQTASNLIACLARQIIGYPKVLPQQLKEMHKELEHQKRRPSFDELRKLLVARCNQYDRVYVIVDALDECEAIQARRLLLPVLEELPRTSGRLFVTSRPNNEDISNTFGKQSKITIAASESDLCEYVAERIAEEERRTSATRFKPELKESIISTVSAGASGMFLLAALQMDRVFAARTIKNVKFALASMPQKIDQLYNLTLERIQQQAGDDGLLAMRILSWITQARRPLSVKEIRHGLAVEFGDDEDNDLSAPELDNDNLLQPESLVDVCAGLVIIDPTSQIIRLVHHTTQEYFSIKRQDLFAEAEADMSRACLTYLSYDIGHRFPHTMNAMDSAFVSHPFLRYASGYWFSHVHSSLSAENPAPVFLDFVARFKCSDSSLRSINLIPWSPDLRLRSLTYSAIPDLECPDQVSALEVASYLGLEELVTVLLDHRTGSYPGLDRSLFWASTSGASNAVNLLLRYGAKVNFIFNVRFRVDTTLLAACRGGHLPVAKVLIENGANPYIGEEPAMHAAAMANEPVIVKLLLKKGVNVNARDSFKRTALHKAAQSRSVGVVKLLLDAHCALDLQEILGRTALHCTAHYGDVATVQLLLDAHCDLDLKDNFGRTALHYAAFNGSVDVVELLLDAQCDLDLEDKEGWTALRWAAFKDCVGIVKKLLDGRCDLNSKDNDGGTALHCAARNGSVDVVGLLLDAQCDLDLEDKYGWTALHYAASSPGALDVLELLLERGADASAKIEGGKTARIVLEDTLSEPAEYYRPGDREKAERLIQRMIQLEQTSSAPSTNVS